MNILEEGEIHGLPSDLVQKASHMSKIYEYLYCIENLLRLHIDAYYI